MKKEIRQKISSAQIGKTLSSTTKKKISEGKKGIKTCRYDYDINIKASSLKEISEILGFSITCLEWCIKGWRNKLDGHDIKIIRKERR